MNKPLLMTLLSLALLGCSPTIETRGNMLSDTKLQEVQPVLSTRADVQQKWGPPTATSVMDPNTWYYIGETTSQQGLFAADVEERKMFRVTFDSNDVVTEIVAIDPKLARDINPVDRKTPAAGKEYTVLQQFIGNLGRFNTNSDKPKAIGPDGYNP